MGHSLKSQLKNAVHRSFKEGRNKHEEKLKDKKWRDKGNSWSYETKHDRLDNASRLANFISENWPEIKLANEIKVEHIQAYLDDCMDRGATQATLQGYSSNCRALCRELENCYKSVGKIDTRKIKTPTAVNKKIRDHQMDTAARDELLKSNSTNVVNAAILSAAFGLRSQEITKVKAKDIYGMDGKIMCHVERGKGNRNREVVAINKERGRMALLLKEKYSDEDKLVPIKDKSLERAITRELKKSGKHEKYIGLHAARKTWAQEIYDIYRKNNHTKLETIVFVNEQLGHSGERDVKLLEKYVARIW